MRMLQVCPLVHWGYFEEAVNSRTDVTTRMRISHNYGVCITCCPHLLSPCDCHLVLRSAKCIACACVAGLSASARLVEQVLDRRQNPTDQFSDNAMQDVMPHALASWLPDSFPGETPEEAILLVSRTHSCMH